MDFSRPSITASRPRPGGELGYKCLSLIDQRDFRDVPRDSVLDEPPKNGDDPTARLLLGCEDLLLIDTRAVGG
jgi:hypothetical protein